MKKKEREEKNTIFITTEKHTNTPGLDLAAQIQFHHSCNHISSKISFLLLKKNQIEGMNDVEKGRV